MTAVRFALMAAAGGTDAKAIVDKVTKVELKTRNDPTNMSQTLVLQVWWDMGEGEFHVMERLCVLDDSISNQYASYVEVLDKLLAFKPEEVLKFAAFL
jgi:hypothetical protein